MSKLPVSYVDAFEYLGYDSVLPPIIATLWSICVITRTFTAELAQFSCRTEPHPLRS